MTFLYTWSPSLQIRPTRTGRLGHFVPWTDSGVRTARLVLVGLARLLVHRGMLAGTLASCTMIEHFPALVRAWGNADCAK